jgi:hypothetical protein
MQIEQLLQKVPLSLVFLIILAVVLLSIAIGFGFGSYTRRRKASETVLSVGSILGAMLGLLAFVLAFTFSLTFSRYQTRKELLLDEANAIGTALLRTDFLAEAPRAESLKLFKEYVNIRVEAVENPKKLPQALIDSEAIQEQLWSQATNEANQTQSSELVALYIESLNEVIDLHSQRVVVGLQYRVPQTVWFLLYFITIQAMLAVGYEFGLSGSISFIGSLLLALMFTAVLVIIKDLDRVGQSRRSSLLRVSQKPLIELQQKLNSYIE